MQDGTCTVGKMANAAAIAAFRAAITGAIGIGGKGIGSVKEGSVYLQQGIAGKFGGGGKLIVAPKVGKKIGGKATGGILKLRQG